ncbi:MAG: lipoprotein-releasing ABC transporter permease subunit [Proteobacteria bacterium]|nr:lipoprotein-releasing ABC transporter permease subunit [Pseudomonadota bacterium]
MLFSGFEWMLAWRYLRSRRADGGVSAMTWISLIGITLAVMALIVTLAVRSGFRHEFVDTILGANANITAYTLRDISEGSDISVGIKNYDSISEKISLLSGVSKSSPLIKGQVMVSSRGRNAGVEVFGIRSEDLAALPRVAKPQISYGNIEDFSKGLAIGLGVARELGLSIGDKVKITSPDGLKTAFGTSPRVVSYKVVYIFQVGRYDIDRTRVYMPFQEAQKFFNREGFADEVEITLTYPEKINEFDMQQLRALFPQLSFWTWRDSSGAFLQALEMEDNVMFLILSILVLIASMNIVSGLIMLVKNKGRDIGILRTIGLTEGSILRVFFLCGATIGVLGTLFGVLLGCLIAVYIDQVFEFINYIIGGGGWDPSVRYISKLPARLEIDDVISAVTLSLTLSFVVTIFPARRAARMNPVEALRYE